MENTELTKSVNVVQLCPFIFTIFIIIFALKEKQYMHNICSFKPTGFDEHRQYNNLDAFSSKISFNNNELLLNAKISRAIHSYYKNTYDF